MRDDARYPSQICKNLEPCQEPAGSWTAFVGSCAQCKECLKKCHVESLKRHNLWFPSSSSMKLVGLRFQKTKDNEGLLINECIFKSGVCFWNLMHCWEPWLWTLLSPKQAINTKTLAANFVSILSQRCLKQLWAQASTQQSLSLRNSPFFRFSPSLRGVDLASLFKNVAFLLLGPRVATSAFKRNIKSAPSFFAL